jgi:hypothetical protein
MQEIIFRAKPVEDAPDMFPQDEFVYGNLIIDGTDCFIVNGIIDIVDTSFTFENYVKVRPETVGRKTEKMDKNGKPIWEFDKVRIVRYDGEIDFTAIVIFRGNEFRILPDTSKNIWVNNMPPHYFNRSEDFRYSQECLEVVGTCNANDIWDMKGRITK